MVTPSILRPGRVEGDMCSTITPGLKSHSVAQPYRVVPRVSSKPRPARVAEPLQRQASSAGVLMRSRPALRQRPDPPAPVGTSGSGGTRAAGGGC